MLEAIGLTKRYGERLALDSLDLKVAPGDVYCLLGANGAGKTTTINLFLGFTRPTRGRALVGGLDVTAEPLRSKRLICYIPEQLTLYANLTGLENLRYFAALAGVADRSDAALLAVLAKAGLPDHATHRRVGTYSKGMRQKVGIGLAIAKQARALLLDEPTSGLDPKASNEFSALLEDLRRSGTAILMATHDLFRAKESGTHIGIMRDGTLRRSLAAEDVGHADLERLYLEHMR